MYHSGCVTELKGKYPSGSRKDRHAPGPSAAVFSAPLWLALSFLADWPSSLLCPDSRTFLYNRLSHHHWLLDFSAKDVVALFRTWPYLLPHHDSKAQEVRILPAPGQVLARSKGGQRSTTAAGLSRTRSWSPAPRSAEEDCTGSLAPSEAHFTGNL